MEVSNLKINNPILGVFTKEYKDGVSYKECMKINFSNFKFEDDNYDVEEVVKLLKKRGFVNNYNGIKKES